MKNKIEEEAKKRYGGQSFGNDRNRFIEGAEWAMSQTKTSKPDITTEGLMNGEWLIKIKGIKDFELHDIEVAVLRLFGKEKRK